MHSAISVRRKTSHCRVKNINQWSISDKKKIVSVAADYKEVPVRNTT